MTSTRRFCLGLALLSASGCSRNEGPALCSAEGIARVRDGGGSESLVSRLCPDLAQTSDAHVESPDAGQWASPPVSALRIKTDATTYTENPAVIYVAVKPSDYFNFGYRNARETHFAFEIAQFTEGDNAQPMNLYGYADKRWARPFFEAISSELEASGGSFQAVPATLLVTYKRSRVESSRDHIEILAASRGEDRSLSLSAAQRSESDSAPVGGKVARSNVGPADEQLLRDARPHVEQWRALQRKVGTPKIVSKELDQFETDRCSVVIEADAPSGESPKAKIRVFLEYRRTTDFWKLTGADSRIFL